MARLHLTHDLISQLITEIAPLVEKETGWNLKIESLTWRIIPRDQAFEELIMASMDDLGKTLPTDRGWAERMLEQMVEANVLAAYDPNRELLLVVEENVDDSNLNGLRGILAHELTHRAQHMQHGVMFERVDNLAKRILANTWQSDADAGEVSRLYEQIQPVMTTLESHAAFVQGRLTNLHFPGAQIESHFNLASIIFRLFAGAKTSQYTQGLPAVTDAYLNDRMDELFQ